jgi:hypothetical protein
MNAVEIEEAISALAEQPFDAAEFPFAFLQAFGNKETTIKRLRKGESNKSDLGGVLQTNNIHIAVASPGEVTTTLAALKASPATTRAKAKFVLATDGDAFEARGSGEWRDPRLRLCRLPGSLRLLPAARRHHHGQTAPRERIRHPRHQSSQSALRRTPEDQPGLGNARGFWLSEASRVREPRLILHDGRIGSAIRRARALTSLNLAQSIDVGPCEVLALEQQRLAAGERQCIRKTVTEIQRGGVTCLAEAAPGAPRRLSLLGVDRDELGPDFEQPEIELAPARITQSPPRSAGPDRPQFWPRSPLHQAR